MCGRYNFSTDNPDEKMSALISVMERKYPGEYKTGDIFPGDTAPAMIARGDKIVPLPAIFGFPGFQDGKLLINARGETAAEKKTFSDSLKEQRVILPATGFYEWSSDKTKYLFSVGSSSVLYLCGLYKIIDCGRGCGAALSYRPRCGRSDHRHSSTISNQAKSVTVNRSGSCEYYV